MGMLGCKPKERIDPTSPKLFKVTMNKIDKLSKNQEDSDEPHNYYDLNISSPKFVLSFYDIDIKKTYHMELSIPVINTLKGMSQIAFKDKIYLCGHQKEIDVGSSSSFLIQIDPYKKTNNNKLFLNSHHHHYEPILLGIKNDLLLVFGGYQQTQCEAYSVTNEKWKAIAILPDERYQGKVMMDLGEQFIYLFGGYNRQYKKNSTTILRLEARYLSEWNTILLKEGSELLGRCLLGITFTQNPNQVLLLGGKDNEEKEVNDIIDVDLQKKVAIPLLGNNISKALFTDNNSIRLDNAFCHMLDDNLNMYTIDLMKVIILPHINIQDYQND